MYPLLKGVIDYLRGFKDRKEVSERLGNVLQSLEFYANASKAAKESAKVLESKVMNLKTPVTAREGDTLVMALVKFSDDFSELLSSVFQFGKECSDLFSTFEPFMEDVKKSNKDVYGILDFFGKHYDPATDSFDLSKIPMFVGIHGKKMGWKKSKDLSEEVERGGEIVRMAILKALVMSTRPPRIRDRLQKEFVRSTTRLSERLAKFKGGENIENVLLPNSPPWLVEFSKILKQAQETMPELSRPGFRKRGTTRQLSRTTAT
jgi:hypothetical protein